MNTSCEYLQIIQLIFFFWLLVILVVLLVNNMYTVDVAKDMSHGPTWKEFYFYFSEGLVYFFPIFFMKNE